MKRICIVFVLMFFLLLSSCSFDTEVEKKSMYLGSDGYYTIGEYPQSLETDEAIIERLNNEFYGLNTFIIIDGVKYLPQIGMPYDENSCFLNGTPIEENKRYWFRVEPIKWIPLSYNVKSQGNTFGSIDENENLVYLITKDLLYPSQFSQKQTTTYVGTERTPIHPSNYGNSLVRNWCTTCHLFNSDEYNALAVQMKIMESWVDSETGKTTQIFYLHDKVSVLNYEMYVAEDSIVRFPNAELKMAHVTDYALCLGAKMDSEHRGSYWLSCENPPSTIGVYAINEVGTIEIKGIIDKRLCIRPTILLDINKEKNNQN